jgi:hypothetical protein
MSGAYGSRHRAYLESRSHKPGVRSQKDAETRDSKLGARKVTSAEGGIYEVVDSRLGRNDLLGGFRISSFDSVF